MPDDIEIKVSEFKEPPGKPIAIDFNSGSKDLLVHISTRCLDKDTDKCNTCRLRYQCYSGQYLIIDYRLLLDYVDYAGQPIEECVEKFIAIKKEPLLKKRQ